MTRFYTVMSATSLDHNSDGNKHGKGMFLVRNSLFQCITWVPMVFKEIQQ